MSDAKIEMIERVARVWADANLDGCETTMDGGNILSCVGKCRCREAARAAIEAMREPTDAMAESTHWGPATGATVWRTMIDAALGKPPYKGIDRE